MTCGRSSRTSSLTSGLRLSVLAYPIRSASGAKLLRPPAKSRKFRLCDHSLAPQLRAGDDQPARGSTVGLLTTASSPPYLNRPPFYEAAMMALRSARRQSGASGCCVVPVVVVMLELDSKTIHASTSSCKMTPSSGSNSPSHGALAISRRVFSYPASQRLRMPDGLKSTSFR